MSFFCKWFGLFCPKPPKPPVPEPPTHRLISVDISGPTEFSTTLEPDLYAPIVGERMVPEAPWHITFRVPAVVTGGAHVRVVAGDQWQESFTRLSVNGTPAGIPLTDTQCDPIEVQPAIVVAPARTGVPRLVGRVFADASGPYLPVGTTLFWATWAWMNDRDKLDQNLAYLSGKVDYIRVLLAVGPGGYWDQRYTRMQDVQATDALTGLTNYAYDKYGIRVMPTLFGTAQGTRQERDAFVEYVGRACAALGEKIHHIEPVNEAENNRFDRDEVSDHAETLRRLTVHEVALTAPFSDWKAYYEGTKATVMTLHLERDVNGTGGMWRPVRQAREGQATGWPWTSNEPIGIASSVAQDDDPLRLTMAAAYTWLCAGASYVLHTGAGIYGIAYQGSTGYRYANLWEQPTMDAVLAGIQTVRRLLPTDLPNWTWLNNNANFPAYPFDTNPLVQEDKVLRSFLMTDNTNFVCMPIRVAADVPYTARRAMEFTHYDPLTGGIVGYARLDAGETYVLPGVPGGQCAAVFIGRYL